MIDKNIRDDMMFFYGNLDALMWAVSNNQAINTELIQDMCERYKSILNRLFDGTVTDDGTKKYYAGFGHCEHEYDGVTRVWSGANVGIMKCKKCGDFYK